jgi:hypothetical protein
MISETDPTNVVLPTPNPPATTIFVDLRGRGLVAPVADAVPWSGTS